MERDGYYGNKSDDLRKELYLETNNDLKIMISSKTSTMTTSVRAKTVGTREGRDARYAPAVSGPYIYIYVLYIILYIIYINMCINIFNLFI